jgi:hypothetical protein
MQPEDPTHTKGTTMFHHCYFERLVESVTLIARHPDYPTKSQALDRCREDVEELIRAGRITVAQAEVLLEILDTGSPIEARSNPRGE